MRTIRDKNGDEIRKYDVLKVFHFIGYKGKRNYMYKHVTIRDGELWGLHLCRPTEGAPDGYPLWVAADEQGYYAKAEIVQSSNGCRCPDCDDIGDAPAHPVPVSSDTVALPRRLTAENGAKALLIGEFFETITIQCQECADDDSSDGCECCKGAGIEETKVPVQWTTIKEIYAKIVEHMGANIGTQ